MSTQAEPTPFNNPGRLPASIQPAGDVRGRYAGFVSRGVAWIIDLALVAAISVVTFWVIRSTLAIVNINLDTCPRWVPVTDLQSLIHNACWVMRGAVYVFSLLLPLAYFVVFWVFGGETVGMGIAGVRVVRTNGAPLTLGIALLRLVGYAVAILPLGLGFIWSLFDDRRQGWHDKLAGTCVVYWRRHRVPERRLQAAASAHAPPVGRVDVP